MVGPGDDPLLRLADLVQAESGIVVRASQRPSLAAALRRIDPTTTAAAVLAEPVPGRRAAILDRLIEALAVNETFFLRHPDELAQLDWPAMARRAARAGRPGVRVWSAGCATGEEPYSLAMLGVEALGPEAAIDVLGTDLSMDVLGRARRGVYGRRAVAPIDAERRTRWFAERSDGAHVRSGLRQRVRLRRHNLTREEAPPAGEEPFDAILCRNVLIYFDAPTSAAVIGRLRGALQPGGTLLLGAADRLSEIRLGSESPRPARPAARSPAAPRPAASPLPAAVPGDAAALDAVAALERGTEALENGDVATAVRLLRRALYLDPGLAAAALALGRAHAAAGDTTAARRAYRRAIALGAQADWDRR